MKVAIIHPDLGIGGAERLIIDIGLAIQQAKPIHTRSFSQSKLSSILSLQAGACDDSINQVTIFTSHFDPLHCFEECKQFSIHVKHSLYLQVHGDFLPRSFFGLFYIIFSILRSFYLALMVYLYSIEFDLIIVDSSPYAIPLLKMCSKNVFFLLLIFQVIYYCHYPDSLLARHDNLARRIYRFTIDRLESKAIAMANTVLVNSKFTKDVFLKTFPLLPDPIVLYPSVRSYGNCDRYLILTLVSINRFERKKNIEMALLAFSKLKRYLPGAKCIIAGGYDKRVSENIIYHKELQHLCSSLSLKHATIVRNEKHMIEEWNDVDVKFLLSFDSERKRELLTKSWVLAYTPENEHFGIVPLEAMSHELPVVSVNSGGPKETIIDGSTGFLIESSGDNSKDSALFASKLLILLQSKDASVEMGKNGKIHVSNNFAFTFFSKRLCSILEKKEK